MPTNLDLDWELPIFYLDWTLPNLDLDLDWAMPNLDLDLDWALPNLDLDWTLPNGRSAVLSISCKTRQGYKKNLGETKEEEKQKKQNENLARCATTHLCFEQLSRWKSAFESPASLTSLTFNFFFD